MEIEVYSKSTTSSQEEFKELLKSEFSKNQSIEEGKVIECTINKVTDNFIYLSSDGLKQEPVLDVREVANLGLLDKIKEGKLKKLSVLLERLEHPKTGEIIVSAEKAMKLDGWNRIVACHKNEEPVNGSILRRCKGGAEVALNDFNLVAFLPGSMVDESPLVGKNFDHLINVPQKFAIVKLDTQRGNVVVSRKHILSSIKSADKKKLIEGYKVDDTVTGTCKQITTFGVFFRLDTGLDVLCHTSELSYSHINSGDEVVSEGEKKQLKIIGIDLDKLQLSVSLKKLEQDPFENIEGKYEVGKIYPVKIQKITEFGFFASLEKNLIALNHSSEISHSKKNVSAKKLFSVGQEVNVAIKEINLDQRRISLSYKMSIPNPYEAFEKKFKIGDILDTVVVAKNDYSLFVRVEDKDLESLEIFVHANNLTWNQNSEEELAKYSIGNKLKVKLLECNIGDQKIRAGVREAVGTDPILFFEKYNVNDRISCKVVSAEKKVGLKVRPIGSEMDFIIKKSAISANPADARVERWTGGETLDVAIAEKDIKKRKIVLSIKLLETLEKAEALEKYGAAEGSGRSLPFSNLAEKILKGKKSKKED